MEAKDQKFKNILGYTGHLENTKPCLKKKIKKAEESEIKSTEYTGCFKERFQDSDTVSVGVQR